MRGRSILHGNGWHRGVRFRESQNNIHLVGIISQPVAAGMKIVSSRMKTYFGKSHSQNAWRTFAGREGPSGNVSTLRLEEAASSAMQSTLEGAASSTGAEVKECDR